MLVAALGGAGSAVAYFGVTGGYALTPGSLNEFVRIALPTAVSWHPPAPTVEPQAAPLAAPEVAGQEIELAAVGSPMTPLADAMPAADPSGAEMTGAAMTAASFSRPPETARASRPITSLAAVQYDLAGGAMSSNAIQTEKKVRVEGAAQSRIKVRIDENSAIYLEASTLAGLLPSSRIPQSSTGFVSFEQLRSEGVDVRYDAALDTIQLKPAGA